jgi:hypothetical protein
MSHLRFPLLIVAICLAGCTNAPQRVPERTPLVGAVTLQAPQAALPRLSSVPATSHASVDSGIAMGMLSEDDSLAPTIPRTFHDICTGEDCETTFRAFACTALTVRADTLDDAPVVAQVPAHDTVEVTHTAWHLTAPGVVLIRRTFLFDWSLDGEGDRVPRRGAVRFTAGDTLHLLHYLSLGSWRWWYRGRVSSSGEFWDGKLRALDGGSELRDSSVAEVVSRPQHEVWWRVELSPPRGGWWHVGRAHEQALSIREMGYWDDGCSARP